MWKGQNVYTEIATAFAITFGVLVVAEIWLGAFNAEIVGDSASHYVSGIFIADLLRGGLLHPIEYLRNFAAHYPFVGIGHWPPLYYGVEALWSFLVPLDKRMVLLAAATAALVATVIYALLRPRLGIVATLFGTAAFTLSPLVLSEVTTLMLDIPVTFGCLMATAAFAQFLRTGRALPVVLFALIASATLLVKGNAGCLALLPLLAIAITRRFERLRSPWLWLCVLIVIVLAGPWYLFTYKMTEAGYRDTFGFNYAIRSLDANIKTLFFAVGGGVLLMAVGGGWQALRSGRTSDPLWASCLALVISVLIFQALVPAALEARYVLPAIPALIVLCAYFLGEHADRRARYAIFAFLLLLVLPGWPSIPHRENLGVAEATQAALRLMPKNNRALLVVSDPDGEAATISELVRQRDPVSEIFGLRGVRLLGGGGYNNQDYLPRYKTLDEVASAISAYRIPLLLLRDPGLPDEWAHIRQVSNLMARDQNSYQLVWSGKGGKLYKINENFALPGEDEMLTQLSAPHGLGGGKIIP